MATNDAARVRSALLWVGLLGVGFAGGWWMAKPQAAPGAAPGAAPVPAAMIAMRPPPPVCVHIDGSAYECPGRADWTQRVGVMLHPGQIKSGRLILTLADTTVTMDLTRENFDAIFLTKSSLSILIEHYDAIHDTVKARDLRAYRDSLP